MHYYVVFQSDKKGFNVLSIYKDIEDAQEKKRYLIDVKGMENIEVSLLIMEK